MSSTIGDYLFWRLATLGARQVLGCTSSSNPFPDGIPILQFPAGTLFIGSVQRNRLTHVDITRYQAIPTRTEIDVFVVSPDAANLAACVTIGWQYYPGRPVVFIQELQHAELRSAADLTAGVPFGAATILTAASTATAQIDSILNTMLYKNKTVYIGISSSMAGVVITVPTAGSAGSGASTGYSVGAGEINAATAAVAMAFIR
ncbi:hypothetical protein P171DRAFT_490351 [Karstenula rhodostoma CBS 690.94]|uniref:Uncharacterized protein n=1 Tax=Karstenula rhodostoma CBS 690.94 TaxID=1392251 RepID=A0A9P4P766_9PLEO|nr:hypothetical protein P171DRAFT_490351 [Karstenula rhodostoma CBS 690.94]